MKLGEGGRGGPGLTCGRKYGIMLFVRKSRRINDLRAFARDDTFRHDTTRFDTIRHNPTRFVH